MRTAPQTDHPLYQALLRPRSVAIVGASDNRAKTTARPLGYLLASAWKGRVFPVNPTRPTVLGERSYGSITDLPEVPDQVYVLAAADAAVAVVRECARLGVPVVSVMADGFVETDPDGASRVAALRDIAARTGTRILGPSSLGVANIDTGLVLTANAAFAELDLPHGGVFLASQSGSAIGALVSRGKDMGVGFHALVSTGGEVDLSLGEICLASVDDPGVESYALFMENLNGVEDLRRFAWAAAERGKPVIAYKLGRSAAGADLAVSHTGALAGDDAVATALLRDLGIARVYSFEALLEAQLLARSTPLHERPLRHPRVGVVSTTGGGGAMVVDCLAVAGAVPTPPSQDTVARLAEHGISAGHGVLIDLTLAGAQYDVMKAALDVMCSAPEFEAVVAVPGSSARFQPDLAVKPIADSAGASKPLAAFVMPAAPDALRMLRDGGVAAFRTPESCADAIVAVFGRGNPRPGDAVAPFPSGDSRVLDEVESYELLGRLGVPHADYAIADTAAPPEHLPVPGPVAVKLLSGDVAHKSDLGGVVLGVNSGEGLRAAIESIIGSVGQNAPGVKVDRVLVQEMRRGLGEVLVGFRHDPDAGPIILLAAGGVLAELYQDRSVRAAPVDVETAHEMISEVVALRALAGFRGLPLGDLDALAKVVVVMSQVGTASGGRVVEAEVNPLLVGVLGAGVVAVDALVRVIESGQA